MRTAQQSKVQQFESTGFQDQQAAAETSSNHYGSYDGELEGKSRGKNFPAKKPIYKFFGGKIFSAMRVVFSSKNSQFFTCVTKDFEMWVIHTKNVGVILVPSS
jgi:hypothetical protein